MSSTATQLAVNVEEVLGGAREGLFVLDSDRHFVFVNPSLERLTG